MKKQDINIVRLGAFVTAGLLFLVLLLYMIGKNRNLFGASFVARARFDNVQGLVAGNNVRYAGIQAGTVKKVEILNDTLIEVVMLIDKKLQPFIRGNASASIGTDGLIGNKVINITPAREPGRPVADGDLLAVRRTADAAEMLRTLDRTNNDVAAIAANLKITVTRLNGSTSLWTLLNDPTLPVNIRASALNVRTATARAAHMAGDLQAVIGDVKDGKGTVGALIRDSSLADSLSGALAKINQAAAHLDGLIVAANATISGIQLDISKGKGAANALLRDSALAIKIGNSLSNIEKGTDGFNQNMEALKHSFLFRGYFRRLEKQQQREAQEKKTTAGRE